MWRMWEPADGVETKEVLAMLTAVGRSQVATTHTSTTLLPLPVLGEQQREVSTCILRRAEPRAQQAVSTQTVEAQGSMFG
jgi:hypothetical protein